MDTAPVAILLLNLCLLGYAAGAVAGLLFAKFEKLANLFSFGCATLASLCGVITCAMVLATGAAAPSQPFELFTSLVPYVQFTVRLDPLGAFFALIVSLLGMALSIYSFGYARGFYGRKNVGVLGAFFNALLLSTTLVFLAGNAFFFLIAWEIMALTCYILISFEHEKDETRNAGVLFFVMSHIGTGCLILGFLLLFQASGNYSFDGFHMLGNTMSHGKRDAAFLLFLAGFGVKAGIVPLHVWLPAAHPVAPSNVSALMSGVIIKAGIYGLVRVLFDFLGTPPDWWGVTLLAIGTISAVLGVLYALMEHDLKRLLAYHS
ncbi:MAG: proton-conducting transporter membrane subunit, partial [Limisphaerales bacterium]